MTNPANDQYDNHRYSTFKPNHWGYYLLLVLAVLFAVFAAHSAYTIEHAGHHITGMNNHIVWGLPHVFAISLIVAASGALNGASMSSLFGNKAYKPYARLSIALAISLLIGGLLVLVLDLGRPDRLIVAMTHYNFRSIFAWNIFLYTGFIFIGIFYLWMLMERKMNRYVTKAGSLAFVWRIILTSGTGSIFGFLVGRNALDTAIMAPLFIALSLAMGTAILAMAFIAMAHWQHQQFGAALAESLEKLLLWFLLAVFYFSVVHHLTNLYASEHHTIERHILSGQHSVMFWLGHVLLGVAIPVTLIVLKPIGSIIKRLIIVSILALLGGAALVYVVVIGSQSTPQRIFPGHEIVSSNFGDAGFAAYSASVWEWGLGLGGIAVAVLLSLFVLRILPFSPVAMSDDGNKV